MIVIQKFRDIKFFSLMKIVFTEFLKTKPTYCVSIVSCWISVVVGHDQKLNIDGWMAVIDSGWCLNMVSSQSHGTRCQHSFEGTSWKWFQIHVKNWVRLFTLHSVEITESYCHATVFSQIFRQINVLLKNFTVNWFDEKFTLTQNFFRQINYLVILLVKSLFSRNFCQKRVTVNFRNFHTVLTEKKFREINSLITSLFSKNVALTDFLSKRCEREFP